MKKLTKANIPHPGLSDRGQLLLVAVCLVMAWLGFWAYAVLADVPATNTATMRIDPVTSEVAAGQTFSVTVMIDDVTNLGAFQFDLSYNASIVNVDVSFPHNGADPGPFPGSTGRSVFEVGPTVNNTTGDMSYGVYTTDGSTPGPNGSGMVATIHFEAVGLGTTPLLLQSVEVTDTSGNVLAVNPPQGGEVIVGGTSPETSTPTHTPTPTATSTSPPSTATPTPTSTPTGEKVYLPIIVKNY